MTLSYRRVLAALSTAAVLSTAALACSTSGGKSMNESLTSELSMNRTIEYLEQSVSALPAGARLDRVHPELQADMTFGGFKPCYDSNAVVDGPEYFGAGYWVVDGGDGQAGLKTLVARWQEWGWTVDDATVDGGNSARGTSSDDYLLSAKISSNGFLSLTGSSPCFPFENGTDLDAQAPGVIEQP
ncbi:hypothetical protein [Rhodococcus sovatensis]|uniref:Lipoprotein n=1 Tax=Rhodococcus sovatensis TaxID=1805840 RepID=A0ABZ2PHM8_9NOCA